MRIYARVRVYKETCFVFMRVAYTLTRTHTHDCIIYILPPTTTYVVYLNRRRGAAHHLDLCVHIFSSRIFTVFLFASRVLAYGMVIVVVHTFWTGKIRIICIYGGTGLVYIIYKDPFKIVFLVKRFKYLVRGRLARLVWERTTRAYVKLDFFFLLYSLYLLVRGPLK